MVAGSNGGGALTDVVTWQDVGLAAINAVQTVMLLYLTLKVRHNGRVERKEDT
jgi:hypothetical protein